MSEVRVNNIVDYGGKGAPTFDNGAVISGVSSLGNQAKIGGNVTITSGGINVSGVTTATLSGNLTGDVKAGFLTATSTVIGSGVTINAGGLNITGVVTATTFEGSGTSLTGVGMTITPLAYNPDVNDSLVTTATGIGITFDHRILAGSGNITIRETNGSGTVVENFGVGSSVTIAGRSVSLTPTSALTAGQVYHINYPSGSFTNTSGDVSYVGTAYTFVVKPNVYELWAWGQNTYGKLGNNNETTYSSPIQIPGTTWGPNVASGTNNGMATKTDGTLWSWGINQHGELGINNRTYYSSPVQIPGTTWSSNRRTLSSGAYSTNMAVKTDGTLWSWGRNDKGELGVNDVAKRSSPVQIPGTTWSECSSGAFYSMAIKTDNTLWAWGKNFNGNLGHNNRTYYSSPVQIPGTTWKDVKCADYHALATKTDGTMWVWGFNYDGTLGQNQAPGNLARVSSPVQVGSETDWNKIPDAGGALGQFHGMASNTSGELWMWGNNQYGPLGDGSQTDRSMPVQIPGNTWGTSLSTGYLSAAATKTDGTLWTWGRNNYGQLGVNNTTSYSSPKQVPGTTWEYISKGAGMVHALKLIP
jgi:alpha-tubulin suppressor-like RCC1 family protein